MKLRGKGKKQKAKGERLRQKAKAKKQTPHQQRLPSPPHPSLVSLPRPTFRPAHGKVVWCGNLSGTNGRAHRPHLAAPRPLEPKTKLTCRTTNKNKNNHRSTTSAKSTPPPLYPPTHPPTVRRPRTRLTLHVHAMLTHANAQCVLGT